MTLPISGLNLTRLGKRKVSVGAGQCKDTTDTKLLVVATGSTLTVDINGSAANGLDTGTVQADTWYAVWIIKNNAGVVAGLFSKGFDGGGVSFPANTIASRRIGSVRTNGAKDLIRFGQSGGSNERTLTWTNAQAQRKVLDNGNATTWTNVSLADWISPKAHTANQFFEPSGCTLEVAEEGETEPVITTSSPINSPFWLGAGHETEGYQIAPGSGSANIYVNGFVETV